MQNKLTGLKRYHQTSVEAYLNYDDDNSPSPKR